MMKKLLLIPVLLGFIGLLSTSALVPARVFAANPLAKACDTLTEDQKKDNATCNVNEAENPLTGPNGLIVKIAKGVALVAGTIAVIVMIVAGITMATSSGDAQSFKTARNAVIYSAVGLVVIVIAQALVTLVINGIGK